MFGRTCLTASLRQCDPNHLQCTIYSYDVFADACLQPSHRLISPSNQEQWFSTGCVHTDLLYVRCCDSYPRKAVYRRVQNCSVNMFSSFHEADCVKINMSSQSKFIIALQVPCVFCH